MTSIAETGNFSDDNSKFAREFEEYRKACQARYQQRSQQSVEQEGLNEEDAGDMGGDGNEEEMVGEQIDPQSTSTVSPTSSTQLPDCNNTPPSANGNDFKLNSSVEMLKLSGQTGRRGSLGKVMSFCTNVFSKKTSSPSLRSSSSSVPSPALPTLMSPALSSSISSPTMEKEKAKMERFKSEQDWRMARFIAELEYEGKTDEDIQLHLFHLRDQAQFARPRSNSIGEWFKGMHQAFKDEFSARRDRQCATVHVSTVNPFAAAVPANYAPDMGYTYEDLVALESVPRGVKSLDHLPTIVFEEGQELPSNQTTCAICMQDFEVSEELRSLQCSHHYHKDCIDKWLGVATACPVCKGEVHSDDC